MPHVRPGLPNGSTHVRSGLPNGSAHVRGGLPNGSTHVRVPVLPLNASYYVSTTGNDTTGDGSIGSPWATPSKAYTVMTSGSSLAIRNGTYTGQTFLTDVPGQYPPNGTAGNYTTIFAETDGGVIFNNSGTSNAAAMGNTTTPALAYVTITGILFKGQSLGTGMYGANHCRWLKCGFEGAADGNNSTFGLSHCTYCLVEDCFAYGIHGRYKFLIYLCSNMIFRRCICRHDGCDVTSAPNPTGSYSIYSSTNVEVQNCIDIDMAPSANFVAVNERSGSFTSPQGSGASDIIHYVGCVSLDTTMQFCTSGSDQVSTPDILFSNCVAYNTAEGGFFRNQLAFDHCTFGPYTGPAIQTSLGGLEYYPGNQNIPPTITNSILQGCPGTALTGFASENGNTFYGNSVNRNTTPTGANSITTNPSLTYITQIETGSPLHNAGLTGDMGANVIYRTGTSGTLYGEAGYATLSATLLWPLPMEAVAAVAMNAYSGSNGGGAVSGDRGFASSANIAAHPVNPLTYRIMNKLGNGSLY